MHFLEELDFHSSSNPIWFTTPSNSILFWQGLADEGEGCSFFFNVEKTTGTFPVMDYWFINN
jgi:hypothetical protein